MANCSRFSRFYEANQEHIKQSPTHFKVIWGWAEPRWPVRVTLNVHLAYVCVGPGPSTSAAVPRGAATELWGAVCLYSTAHGTSVLLKGVICVPCGFPSAWPQGTLLTVSMLNHLRVALAIEEQNRAVSFLQRCYCNYAVFHRDALPSKRVQNSTQDLKFNIYHYTIWIATWFAAK